MSSRKLQACLASLALLASVAVVPSFALGPEKVLRFGGMFLMPMERTPDDQGFPRDPDVDYESRVVLYEADDAIAPFVSFEYPIGPKTGVEVAAWSSTFDLDVTIDEVFDAGDPPATAREVTTGEVTVTPITVGINYHASTSDKWDIYVGAFLLYALMDDLQIDGSRPLSLGLENEFSWGGAIGIDYKPKRDGKWRFTSSIRYTFIDAEISENGADNFAIEIDPLSAQVGAGYAF